jgi:mycofactocin system glycosyltransferase
VSTAPLPSGLPIVLDPSTRQIGQDLLSGGSPRRLLRLTPAGRAAYAEIASGRLESARGRQLARRLTDAGLAHPRPRASGQVTATVIVPVRDRPAELGACLAALGGHYPVVVVDDGSRDPDDIASVVAAHGARLLRRDTAGGPGAARNAGLAAVDTEVVAFIDSDCVPPPGWVEALAAHLRDPAVAVAAPRIVPVDRRTAAQRYAVAAGSLDLGQREARVLPLTPVAYVPTAALVARRSALLEIAVAGKVFDESMRYGEDVDLIWRVHGRGWRIRFDPSVQVGHREPASWRGLLARRFRYGTSAAPLSQRHFGVIAPVVLQPLAAVTIAAAVAGQPVAAAVTFAVGVARTRRAMSRAGLRGHSATVANARIVAATAVGAGRYLTQFAFPVVAVATASGPARRGLGLGALLAVPVVHRWFTRRPPINPVSFATASVADDLAYGAGVYAGAVRHRTAAPLLPAFATSKERDD